MHLSVVSFGLRISFYIARDLNETVVGKRQRKRFSEWEVAKENRSGIKAVKNLNAEENIGEMYKAGNFKKKDLK